MCGISGYFSRSVDHDLSNELKESLNSILYRGPDANNTWIDKNAGLAHARLSIIDLSDKGKQPMHSEDANFHIVFNGEIYNFKELKNELISKGYSFISNSDTEVILQGYRYWGTGVFSKLNGMFSLGIYDQDKEVLILARDRFGIKPLYYFLDEDNCYFASEMASLLCFPIRRKLDHQALSNYFQFSYIPKNKSIIEGVGQLDQGCFLKVSKKEKELHKYYRISTTSIDISYDEAIQGISQGLEKSVERRLLADVPVATFLSGGVDSSIITLLASERKPGLKSFSAGFSEYPYFDESVQAKEWGQHLSIDHSILDLKQDDLLSSIDELLAGLSEPFADTSAIAYYLLSKHVSGQSKVVLSGDGADELFGGYRKHKAEYLTRKYASLSGIVSKMNYLTGSAVGNRNSRLGNLKRQLKKWVESSALSNEERYTLWASMASERELSSLLVNNRGGNHIQIDKLDSLNEMLKMDMEVVLAGDMLTKVDRTSMLNSLEVRVPFLDHELVDFVFSLPSEWKLKKGKRKALLRDAFRGRIPKQILNRSKKGFEVPLNDWLQGPLKDKVDKVLNKEIIMDQGIINYEKVNSLISQSRSSNPGNSPYLIWSLLVFQNWVNRYNPEL